MNNYILFLLAFVFLIILVLLRKSKFNRHKVNINKASRVLNKLRGFDGDYKEGKIINYLRKIDPFVFEELLLNAFEQSGYKAIRNKRYTGDGGIDGKLIDKNNNLILVQAKRYTNHINNADVQEFSQLVSNSRATKGYFIHTGKTGKGIYKTLSLNKNVEVVSGNKLIKLIIQT